MIRAENYETVSKFVEVMPRILWPVFSGHRVCMLHIYDKAFLKAQVMKKMVLKGN